jgi:hypothetical protein
MMRQGSILTRAAELLNPVTGQWNEEMVTSTFWSEEVPTILVIPVHMEMDDIVAWHFEPKGCFSVKLAYRLFCDDQQQTAVADMSAESSGRVNEDEKFWHLIWNLDCPNRVKHFMWRLAHNSLAL